MKILIPTIISLASLLLSCTQETVQPDNLVKIEGISFNAKTDTSTVIFSAKNDYILTSLEDQTLIINHGEFTKNHFEITMPLNPSTGIKHLSNSTSDYSILWKTEDGKIYSSLNNAGSVNISELKQQYSNNNNDEINLVLKLSATFSVVLTSPSDSSTVTISDGIIRF